jgi:hypothetical protein
MFGTLVPVTAGPREPDPYEDLAMGPSELSTYVVVELLTGRRFFDVLTDEYVIERLEYHPSPLEHLARDPFVRGALAAVP